MTKIPTKPRKHRWITQAIGQGVDTLSVWPSKDDLSSESKQEKFLEVITKIANDPRVTKIEKVTHEEHNWIFLFRIDPKA